MAFGFTQQSLLRYKQGRNLHCLFAYPAASLFFYNFRSIDICDQLSKSLGCEVGPGNIRYALAVANGRNCSAKYKGIWDLIDDLGLVSGGVLTWWELSIIFTPSHNRMLENNTRCPHVDLSLSLGGS